MAKGLQNLLKEMKNQLIIRDAEIAFLNKMISASLRRTRYVFREKSVTQGLEKDPMTMNARMIAHLYQKLSGGKAKPDTPCTFDKGCLYRMGNVDFHICFNRIHLEGFSLETTWFNNIHGQHQLEDLLENWEKEMGENEKMGTADPSVDTIGEMMLKMKLYSDQK